MADHVILIPTVARVAAGLLTGLMVLTAAATADSQPIMHSHDRSSEQARASQRSPAYDRHGTASWYGPAHQGQLTASGETFDMNALTAAHRTLPLGSRIKVTNLRNGKSVVLTVNDRGPYIRGRIVDVSYRAARDLDFVGPDLAPVRVETVGSY